MPNLRQIVDQLESGIELSHQVYPIDVVPTGYNTPVENPGDRKLTKKQRKFNTELARRQGGAQTIATTITVARTSSVDNVYS